MKNPIESKTYVYVTSPEHRKYIELMAEKSGFKKQEGYTGKGPYISFWGDRVFTDTANLFERLSSFKQVFIDMPESNPLNDSSIENTSEAKNPIAPNTKICILSPKHSEYVQKLSFEAGFEWCGDGKVIMFTESDFLFFKDGWITKSKDRDHFVSSEEIKEIFIDLPTEHEQLNKRFSDYAEKNETIDESTRKTFDTALEEGAKNAQIEASVNRLARKAEKFSAMKKGQKHDTDKPRYDLIPVHAEAAVVDVLTFGANKYAPDNWRHVENATERYTAAALRHIAAYRMGDHEDKESGLPHLAHAVCCLVFMLELDSEADK